VKGRLCYGNARLIQVLSQRTVLKLEDDISLVRICHSEYRWRKVRNEHVRDESCCQMCLVIKKLEAHHVIPWHVSPLLRYERSNLVTLCRACHYRFGHWLNWKEYNPRIRELCENVALMRVPVIGVHHEATMANNVGDPNVRERVGDSCQRVTPTD